MSALALQIDYVSNECTVEVLGNKQVSCIVLSIATNMSGICLRLRHLESWVKMCAENGLAKNITTSRSNGAAGSLASTEPENI